MVDDVSLARQLTAGLRRALGIASGLDRRAPLAVSATPVLSGSLQNYGTTTVAYSSSLSASGGATPYTWSISVGALPTGLSLNTATGVISGTPSGSAGTSNFTVRCTGADALYSESAQSITVALYPTLSGTLTFATISTAYSQGLTASNGHAPLAWDISAGALPAGLSIDSSTGVISGTPTAYGDNSFTVRVTDAHGNVATSAQAVTVYGPELISSITDGSWTINLQSGAAGTVTQDGTGFHWSGANNLAGVFKSITTVDNGVYEVTYTRSGSSLGGSKFIVYGATTAHAGISTGVSVDGSTTTRVTCNGAGSNALQFRFQATGANGSNTFNVTALSCKRVG